jgi:DNA invertase Pin-like site-specific DNA recombinase
VTEPLYQQRVVPYAPRQRRLAEAVVQDHPRCWGYVRVSLDKQATNTSLEHQEKVVRSEYERRYKDTHEMAEVVAEAESGATLRFDERPGGRKLLEIMKPGDVLIVAKVDRFGRRLVDGLVELKRLRDRGINVLCLDMGGMLVEFDGGPSEVILTLMLWAAQFERNRMRERTTAGQRAHRAKYPPGHPKAWKPNMCRYGTKRGPARAGGRPHRIPDPEHRAFVRNLLALYTFAAETFGYSKCDIRHRRLAVRYDLLWWRNYSAKGANGDKRPVFEATYLKWFAEETKLLEQERAAGRPPPDPPDEPWRRDHAAGLLVAEPKPEPPSWLKPLNAIRGNAHARDLEADQPGSRGEAGAVAGTEPDHRGVCAGTSSDRDEPPGQRDEEVGVRGVCDRRVVDGVRPDPVGEGPFVTLVPGD